MNSDKKFCCAKWTGWIVQRNPMYLLSAACMAVGARLYLVDPSTRAGDIGIILLTAGHVWPWTRYRGLALGVWTSNIVFYGSQWILGGQHPVAAMVVIGSFALLASGAIISWYKPKIITAPRFAPCNQPALGPE